MEIGKECTDNQSGFVEPRANVLYYKKNGLDGFPQGVVKYTWQEQIDDDFDEYKLFPFLCIRSCGGIVPANGMWCPDCISKHQARLLSSHLTTHKQPSRPRSMRVQVVDLTSNSDTLHANCTIEGVPACASNPSLVRGVIATTPQHKSRTLAEASNPSMQMYNMESHAMASHRIE